MQPLTWPPPPPPDADEIPAAIVEGKDSAPGIDKVSIRYIQTDCREIRVNVIELVQEMTESRGNK